MNSAYWRLLRRSFLVLPILCLTLGCPLAKKETKKEKEVPDAEAQAQKEKEILELFKDKEPSDLPAIFFEKGVQTKDDPVGRFVLLRLARDKAAEACEPKRAYDAVDELAKSFDDVDALEMKYPMLRGTIRDQVTKVRRPLVRFFACEEDLSHESPDAPLPDDVASGKEPLLVIGAIAGG